MKSQVLSILTGWYFMQRSDGGGVFDILDRINGRNLCGCETVIACQVSCIILTYCLLVLLNSSSVRSIGIQ